MAAVIGVEKKRNDHFDDQSHTQVGQLVEALMSNGPVEFAADSTPDVNLKRKLHRALRINVVHDPKAIPPKFHQLAAKAAGTSILFSHPITFAKVHGALKDLDPENKEKFGSEYLTVSARLYEAARARPSERRNAALLKEAQGRLWFRLRL